jgi:F5/8 type C domain
VRRMVLRGLVPWIVSIALGSSGVFGWPGQPEAVASAIANSPAASSTVTVIDNFDTVTGWSAHPADGVELEIGTGTGAHGNAMRLDFRFHGGGYAVARKSVALDLPENYAFTFRVRGESPLNHLEFKLIDASDDNVWWCVQRDFQFPKDWQTVKIKKRQIQFAWGPLGGGEIHHVAAIEIVVTAGSGGAGTVWIDDLELRTLPAPNATPPAPIASASSIEPEHGAERAIDQDPQTSWSSRRGDARPWIALDLGGSREYGGLTVRWAADRYATDYVLETSDDGTTWQEVRRVRSSNGGRDDLALPESESRVLRLRVLRTAHHDGVAISELVLRPLEWAATRNAFFESVASEMPRGSYPRAFSGEQSFWTVVGIDNDDREALLDEDGRIETGPGGFSIEPFVYTDGKLLTWNDARTQQSLDQGSLPIPTTHWFVGDLELEVTAFGTGNPGASAAVARYRVTNHGPRVVRGTLFLAARPFQVNPPSQFLNTPGGYAPLHDLDERGALLVANGEPAVATLTEPEGFGAVTFDGGGIVGFLRDGRLPARARVRDDFAAASAAWSYPFALVPRTTREIDLVIPLHRESPLPQVRNDAAARDWTDARLEEARLAWGARLARVSIEIPDATVTESLRAQLGWIFVNRAGPAIQPGSRAYARSWIRDGALTCSALLRLGQFEAVREFIEWFAPYQFPNGKIPCVVDRRGADPVPEHDSSGEFVYLVAEYTRFTGDRELAERMFPRVRAAVDYLDSLRLERRTKEYEAPERREFFGILPPSISHEGYSAKPMHSYWDDFWAVRGFHDAVYLAGSLGHEDDRQRIAAIASTFEADLTASVRAAMQRHHIDYVPGCADLGDFDATSTTIALAPTGAATLLPADAVRRTFEKYGTFFDERASGAPWDAFTPYEMRNLGAFIRLGWRHRVPDLLGFFLAAQRPAGWRQWPEVVWHDERVPHFIGDLPHTWVGSDYIRSILDALAYERDADDALVLGAGVPLAWLSGSGVRVHDLRTRYGPLSFTMQTQGDAVVLRIESGPRIPSGGIVLQPPLAEPARLAIVDGESELVRADGTIVLHRLPATVVVKP